MNLENWIIEPEALAERLGDSNLCIIDLCTTENYAAGHIPGALHLDYPQIVRKQEPVMGLLPEAEDFGRLLGQLGITPQTEIIAYDDEGGGKAARLIYTLAVAGHGVMKLLNGGLQAWSAAQLPLTPQAPAEPKATEYAVTYSHQDLLADRDYILAHLDDPAMVVIDARSPGEYAGTDVRANRGGHIPGAINQDWLTLMDREHDLRLRDAATLAREYQALGVTPDKDIVVHCQTHHRSALTFVVLKALGYAQVRGYPGSWSDWGNNNDTPIEQ